MNYERFFAKRTAYMKRSTIREILKLTAQPEVISFAGGLPAPEFFPTEEVAAVTEVIMAERGQEALQYSATEGLPELRGFVADRLSSNGLRVGAENVLIISGSQQGLDLTGRVLVDEGDRIFVENPTYLGVLMAWMPYHVDYCPVATDGEGLLIDSLVQPEDHPAKLMYAVPNFQNPQGITLTEARRKKLIEFIHENDVLLIEDNPYGELRYDGDPIPHLLQLDSAYLDSPSVGDQNRVIHVGTFSKVLTPGLRVGWVAAPYPIIDKLVQAKQSADLHTSTLAQFIVYQLTKDGFLDKHIGKLRGVYKERRDVMLAAMEQHFPEEATWNHPDGGLFLMAYLPQQINSLELLEKSLERKVAFVPGTDFHTDGTGHNTIRLNFSNAKPEMIEAGIKRLGDVIKDSM